MFRYLGVNQVRNIDSLYSGENIEINRNLTGDEKEDNVAKPDEQESNEDPKGNKNEEKHSSEPRQSHSSEKRSSHSDRFNHKRDDHHKSSHHQKSSHQSSSNRSQPQQRYQRQLQLDKFNRFRRSVSVEPSAYRSQTRSFIQKPQTPGAYAPHYQGRRKNKAQQARREGWGDMRYSGGGRGKRGGYQGRGRGGRRQQMRNMMINHDDDDDAMDLEMPPPPHQHFCHNNKGFKSNFPTRPPLLPLPIAPPPPSSSLMMMPPPPPPLRFDLPPPLPTSASALDVAATPGSSSEAIQKEKYEHNRMLAEKRDEHLVKEKSLYEDLHLLQSQRAKILKQCDPQNNKIVKENEKLQDEIRKKIEATKSAVQMLTEIIGDHMKHTVPQISRRPPASESESSDGSASDSPSSESSTASEATNVAEQPFVQPRPLPKRYKISRNRNIFVRRRDITTRDRRKIDTTAYIQTAGQAVLKSQQQETLEEKSQKMEAKLHQCEDTDNEDIFPLVSSVENKMATGGAASRTMEEDIEDIFNLRRAPATRSRERSEEKEEEREEETASKAPRRKSPTTIIEEIILDGNEDVGGMLTRLDQEHGTRRTNIQITLKKREKRNKAEEEKKEKEGKPNKVPEPEVKPQPTEPETKQCDGQESRDASLQEKEESTTPSGEEQHTTLDVFWCQACNEDFASDVQFLSHLQSKAHARQTEMDPPRPALSPAPSPVVPPSHRLHRTCLGSQWLIPVPAWFCQLCRECFVDIRRAAAHLQSEQHWEKLEHHTTENPLWEVTLLKAHTEASLSKRNKSLDDGKPTDDTEPTQVTRKLSPSPQRIVSGKFTATPERQASSKLTVTPDRLVSANLTASPKTVDPSNKDTTNKRAPCEKNADQESAEPSPNERSKLAPQSSRHAIFEEGNTRDATGEKSKLWVPNRKEFDKLASRSQQDMGTGGKKKPKPSFIGKMPMGGGKGKIKINVAKASDADGDRPSPSGEVDRNLAESVGNILSQLSTIYRNEQETIEIAREREILLAERELAARQMRLNRCDADESDKDSGEEEASSRLRREGSPLSSSSGSSSRFSRSRSPSSSCSRSSEGGHSSSDGDTVRPSKVGGKSKASQRNKKPLRHSTTRQIRASSDSSGSSRSPSRDYEELLTATQPKYVNFNYDTDSSEDACNRPARVLTQVKKPAVPVNADSAGAVPNRVGVTTLQDREEKSDGGVLARRKPGIPSHVDSSGVSTRIKSGDRSAPVVLTHMEHDAYSSEDETGQEYKDRRYNEIMNKYQHTRYRDEVSQHGSIQQPLEVEHQQSSHVKADQQRNARRTKPLDQHRSQPDDEEQPSRHTRVSQQASRHASRRGMSNLESDSQKSAFSDGASHFTSVSQEQKSNKSVSQQQKNQQKNVSRSLKSVSPQKKTVSQQQKNIVLQPVRRVPMRRESVSPASNASLSRSSGHLDGNVSRSTGHLDGNVSRSSGHLDVDFMPDSGDEPLADESVVGSVGEYFEARRYRSHIDTFLEGVPDESFRRGKSRGGESLKADESRRYGDESGGNESFRGEESRGNESLRFDESKQCDDESRLDGDVSRRHVFGTVSRLSDEEFDGQTGLSDRVESIMRRQKKDRGLSETSSEREVEDGGEWSEGKGGERYEEKIGGEVEYMSDSSEGREEALGGESRQSDGVDQRGRPQSELSGRSRSNPLDPIGFKGAIFFNKPDAESAVQLPFLSDDPALMEPPGDVYQDCDQLRNKLERVKSQLSRVSGEGKQYSSFQDAFRDHRERCAIQMRGGKKREGEDDFATKLSRGEEMCGPRQRVNEGERSEEGGVNEGREGWGYRGDVEGGLQKEGLWDEGGVERVDEMGAEDYYGEEEAVGGAFVATVGETSGYRESQLSTHEPPHPRDTETPVGAIFTRNRANPRKYSEHSEKRGGGSDEESEESFDTGSSKRKRVNKYLEEEERLKTLETGDVEEEKWGEESGRREEENFSLEEQMSARSSWKKERVVDRRGEEVERAVRGSVRRRQEEEVKSLKEEETRLQLEKKVEETRRQFLEERKRQLEVVSRQYLASSGASSLTGMTVLPAKRVVPQSLSHSQHIAPTRRRLAPLHSERFRFDTKISDTDCSELIDPTIDVLYANKRAAVWPSHRGDCYPSRGEFVNYALKRDGLPETVTLRKHSAVKQVALQVSPATHFQTIEHGKRLRSPYNFVENPLGKDRRASIVMKKRKPKLADVPPGKKRRPEPLESDRDLSCVEDEELEEPLVRDDVSTRGGSEAAVEQETPYPESADWSHGEDSARLKSVHSFLSGLPPMSKSSRRGPPAHSKSSMDAPPTGDFSSSRKFRTSTPSSTVSSESYDQHTLDDPVSSEPKTIRSEAMRQQIPVRTRRTNPSVFEPIEDMSNNKVKLAEKSRLDQQVLGYSDSDSQHSVRTLGVKASVKSSVSRLDQHRRDSSRIGGELSQQPQAKRRIESAMSDEPLEFYNEELPETELDNSEMSGNRLTHSIPMSPVGVQKKQLPRGTPKEELHTKRGGHYETLPLKKLRPGESVSSVPCALRDESDDLTLGREDSGNEQAVRDRTMPMSSLGRDRSISRSRLATSREFNVAQENPAEFREARRSRKVDLHSQYVPLVGHQSQSHVVRGSNLSNQQQLAIPSLDSNAFENPTLITETPEFTKPFLPRDRSRSRSTTRTLPGNSKSGKRRSLSRAPSHSSLCVSEDEIPGRRAGKLSRAPSQSSVALLEDEFTARRKTLSRAPSHTSLTASEDEPLPGRGANLSRASSQLSLLDEERLSSRDSPSMPPPEQRARKARRDVGQANRRSVRDAMEWVGGEKASRDGSVDRGMTDERVEGTTKGKNTSREGVLERSVVRGRLLERDVSASVDKIAVESSEERLGQVMRAPSVDRSRGTARDMSVDRTVASREMSVERRSLEDRETSVDRNAPAGRSSRAPSTCRSPRRNAPKPAEPTSPRKTPMIGMTSPRISPMSGLTSHNEPSDVSTNERAPSRLSACSSTSGHGNARRHPKHKSKTLEVRDARQRNVGEAGHVGDVCKVSNETQRNTPPRERVPSRLNKASQPTYNSIEDNRMTNSSVYQTSDGNTNRGDGAVRRNQKNIEPNLDQKSQSKQDSQKTKAAHIENERRRLFARMQELEQEIQQAKQLKEEVSKRELQQAKDTSRPQEAGQKSSDESARQKSTACQMGARGETAGAGSEDDKKCDTLHNERDTHQKHLPRGGKQQDAQIPPVAEINTNMGNSRVSVPTPRDSAVKTEIDAPPNSELNASASGGLKVKDSAYLSAPAGVKTEGTTYNSGASGGVKSEDSAYSSTPGGVKMELDDEHSSGSRENYDGNVQMTQYVSSKLQQASSSPQVGHPVTPPLFIPGIFIKSNEQFVVKSSTIYKKKAMSKKARLKEKKKRLMQQAGTGGENNKTTPSGGRKK